MDTITYFTVECESSQGVIQKRELFCANSVQKEITKPLASDVRSDNGSSNMEQFIDSFKLSSIPRGVKNSLKKKIARTNCMVTVMLLNSMIKPNHVREQGRQTKLASLEPPPMFAKGDFRTGGHRESPWKGCDSGDLYQSGLRSVFFCGFEAVWDKSTGFKGSGRLNFRPFWSIIVTTF